MAPARARCASWRPVHDIRPGTGARGSFDGPSDGEMNLSHGQMPAPAPHHPPGQPVAFGNSGFAPPAAYSGRAAGPPIFPSRVAQASADGFRGGAAAPSKQPDIRFMPSGRPAFPADDHKRLPRKYKQLGAPHLVGLDRCTPKRFRTSLVSVCDPGPFPMVKLCMLEEESVDLMVYGYVHAAGCAAQVFGRPYRHVR